MLRYQRVISLKKNPVGNTNQRNKWANTVFPIVASPDPWRPLIEET
jgi:hypothetical protein